MRTVPLFVPAGDDHVATVVTVPEGPPKGLVVVLAGTGRHNVIGGTMAGLLSERLARRGLASARLDYAGVGDSPGLVGEWSPADVRRATAAAHAVVSTVGEELGTARFAGVGTCYGSRVALELVDDARCVGAICLAPPVLDHRPVAAAGRRLGTRRVASVVRSSRLLRALLAPAIRLARRRRPARRVLDALSHLDRARVVFLYGRPPEEDHFGPRARESAEARVAQLPPEQQARFEIRMLDLGPLTTFDGLDAAEQQAILDVVEPLVLDCFEAG